MIKLKFKSKPNGIPIISKADIEYFSEAILGDYNTNLFKNPTAFDIEDFLEFHVGLEIDYKDLTKDKSTIGMMVFSDGNIPVYNLKEDKDEKIWVNKDTIIIDNSLLQENQVARGRFTLCHELSHWILHRHIYEKNENQLSLFDSVNEEKVSLIKCRDIDVESTYKKRHKDDNCWMEWQADYMASSLLMPRSIFISIVKEKFKLIGIHDEFYELGSDLEKDYLLNELYVEITRLFNVSLTAAKIRLKNLGLIIAEGKNQQLYFI